MNQEQDLKIQENLNKIKNTYVVISGKGGVGKSTMATNLAMGLALKGFKTGLLDIDVHGPSIPTLFDLEGKTLMSDGVKIFPAEYGDNLKIISVGFLVEDPTKPIVWRGPVKTSFIRQMVGEVHWGELDYLIVDCPPGTGDEPLSIIQTLQNVTGAVIVTTPQKLALVDVKKSINFCKELNVKIIGVIENMSGFVCSKCGEIIEIFKTGGGEKMAKEMDVPFLGKVPLSKEIVDADDNGTPLVKHYRDSESTKSINEIIDKIIQGNL